MAGALASAVAYCVHAMRGATDAAAGVAAADEPRAAIMKYLQIHYDDVEYRRGGYAVHGLAYVGAPLVELNDLRLRRFKPDTRFFKTKLLSPRMEYPKVEMLVSYRRFEGRDDIRTCLSPVYQPASSKFFSRFIGVEASTWPEQRELALALVELLAEVTYEGEARPAPGGVSVARAELWHGPLHWRDVDVVSGREGWVTSIVISNPISKKTDVILNAMF
jgi:hypothetical protein